MNCELWFLLISRVIWKSRYCWADKCSDLLYGRLPRIWLITQNLTGNQQHFEFFPVPGRSYFFTEEIWVTIQSRIQTRIWQHMNFYRPWSKGDNTFGSVHLSIRPFVYALPFEPLDLWPWYLAFYTICLAWSGRYYGLGLSGAKEITMTRAARSGGGLLIRGIHFTEIISARFVLTWNTSGLKTHPCCPPHFLPIQNKAIIPE